MSLEEFYNKLRSRDKKERSKQELINLHLKPKKDDDKETPHAQVFEPNVIQQADLLFMPNDDGYKYILVVTDLHSKKVDAEPLKTKESSEVKAGFEKIYARHYLDLPLQLEVDDGQEFKGDTKKYLDDNNVRIRVAPAGRHRSMAYVERANQTIGTVLHKRMTAQELLTGQPSLEWKDDLPRLIKIMNRHRFVTKRELSSDPITTKRNQDLLDIGTKVRVMYDNPKDITNDKRLHGKFRSSDIRWDSKVRTVKDILLKPGYPPLYLLDGSVSKRKLDMTARTKNQLQVIPEDEKEPLAEEVIRGKPSTYIVKKILDDKIEKRKKMLLIQWKGYKTPTWESLADISKDVPDKVKAYLLSKMK